MIPKPKCLVIGLDGGRGDLIDHAIKSGHAPAMASIRGYQMACESCHDTCARPQSGPFTEPDGWGMFLWKTTPGWASVFTGVDNDKHRIHQNNEENVQLFWKSSKHYPTFFHYARQHKYRTLAVGRPSVIGDGRDIGILDKTPLDYKQIGSRDCRGQNQCRFHHSGPPDRSRSGLGVCPFQCH